MPSKLSLNPQPYLYEINTWPWLEAISRTEGRAIDLGTVPDRYWIDGRVLANGRDPYFPAWPDVVQLNAFAPALRAVVIETLSEIAEQCDGVRCDMAMLVINDVFGRTWGDRVGSAPESDYWPTVIPAVREAYPGFLFLAEAYWDLEWALQQQGFNYCYDKRLYDRILQGPADQVRLHLLADDQYQHGLLRFVENHDEPRAVSAFGSARSGVAAVTALTQTGARLVHNGQLEGATVHLPVFLGRDPSEPTDLDLITFYRSFLTAVADPTFRNGRWKLCDRSGWSGDDRYQDLLAWCWQGDTRWLIVVNLSDGTAAAEVRTQWADLRGRQCHLTDPTQNIAFIRSGDDLVNGLFVELDAWKWHMFRVEPR